MSDKPYCVKHCRVAFSTKLAIPVVVAGWLILGLAYFTHPIPASFNDRYLKNVVQIEDGSIDDASYIQLKPIPKPAKPLDRYAKKPKS